MTTKECPQCGAPLSRGVSKCEYCKAALFVSSVSCLSNYDNSQIQKYIKYYKKLIADTPDDDKGYLGLGICYLQLSMYSLAKKELEKAIEIAPENSSAYYYYCLASIAGQRIRSLSFDTIEELLRYLNTAINLEPDNSLYLLLMMLIKHDFYVLNSLKQPAPTYEDLLQTLSDCDIDDDELVRLKSCVKIADFGEFGL